MPTTIQTQPQEGDLQMWWIPQVPMKPFIVSISSLEEGIRIMDILANYDLFQYENNVKPDYANVGGISRYEGDGEGGLDWFDLDEHDIEDMLATGSDK